ncbi:hypothetical protein F442_14994 [Phytophthora nicotianae P10297]|uniref:Uncharacterized protein n=1 Tax=Phytophthora nicotianae P10297 TaxID=1317064 RepID=W2YQ22_PHYNI|nr:hypothetical protein F442_14994 [Phytophthora nicotianae P10297]
MAPRRSGGSQTTIPPRSPRKVHDRDEAAYLRAVAKLGLETAKQLRADWDSWDTGYGGKEWSQSENVVLLPTRFSSNGELVHLPRKPAQDLSDKKMKSLSAKYFSIPQQHLTDYPAVPDSIIDAPDLGAAASDAERTPKFQSKRKPG